MKRYDPTTRARELSGRAVAEFCAGLCHMLDGAPHRARFQFGCADESACWALAWHFGLIGDRSKIEQAIWLLLTRERLDREIASWRGVETERVQRLEVRARSRVRKAVERAERRRKKAGAR